MKVCFCGLGSIAKRHLKNLSCLAEAAGLELEIHALRHAVSAPEAVINGLTIVQTADPQELDRDYDAAFITNPASLHYETMKQMAGRTRHMFIEKPVFNHGDYDLEALGLKEEGVYYVAGPLRYTSVVRTMREITRRESIFSARAICSSYLPDWRGGTDYRQTSSAQNKLGGGVGLDLIHEWDYLIDLFGFPQSIYKISGKYSPLEIDSDDLTVYIAAYADKVVELHLDYFGREPRRELELFTERGIITGDLIKNTVSFTDGTEQIQFNEGRNDMYLAEMRFFLDLIRTGETFNNMARARAVLNIALGSLSS